MGPQSTLPSRRREGGGALDHAISRAMGGAAAGGAGRRAPRSVQVTWRRTGATVATAGTPARARGRVGGAGHLVGTAADSAPDVLVASGRAPTRARGVCRACAAAAVVIPTTAVVRPSAAPGSRPGALFPGRWVASVCWKFRTECALAVPWSAIAGLDHKIQSTRLTRSTFSGVRTHHPHSEAADPDVLQNATYGFRLTASDMLQTRKFTETVERMLRTKPYPHDSLQ